MISSILHIRTRAHLSPRNYRAKPPRTRLWKFQRRQPTTATSVTETISTLPRCQMQSRTPREATRPNSRCRRERLVDDRCRRRDGRGHNDSSSFQGALSEHGNDQFHFANANPGNNGLGHQSLELPSQAASPATVDIPPATTELAQILDDILTQAAQAPLDTVTAPGQNHELPWTNAHQDKPSNDFIIHA